MNNRELESRTKHFALRCLELADALPKSFSGKTVANQLARSGTSVGANYRAANRARSKAEWFAKLCIVIEECDESVYWLEIVAESGMQPAEKISPLTQEARELLAIFAKSRATARERIVAKQSSNQQVAKSLSP